MTCSESSCLISARTSIPSFRGRLRSRITRSGRGAPVCGVSRRRKAIASSPSVATWSSFATFPMRRVSAVRRISPGLSSTSKIWIGLLSSAIWSLRGIRDGEAEYASSTGGSIDPDPAAQPLHRPLTDRESQPCAGVLAEAMEALEGREDPFGVHGIDPDAVILHRETPVLARSCGREAYARNYVKRRELQRIGDEVLEDLSELGRIGGDCRERAHCDVGVLVVDDGFERRKSVGDQFVRIDGDHREFGCAHLRVVE